MNPYEKYYLRQKLLVGAIAVGATALVTGGVMLWQPWNHSENSNSDPEPAPIEDTTPDEDTAQPDLTITVGGKKIDCMLYRGDGWSIPYPIDWSVEETETAVSFSPPNGNGAALTVSISQTPAYNGAFISAGTSELNEKDVFKRLFYYGDARGYEVSCLMPSEQREDLEKTMTAMARTMTVGDVRPFASLYPMASEPEWQIIDGETILFMDKDGVDMASITKTAVERYMNAWSSQTKANFTGTHRFDPPTWVASYTCVTEDYVDVFAVSPEYQIAAGKAGSIVLGEGQSIQNGWLSDSQSVLYIVLFHDGSTVSKTAAVWNEPGYDGADFVKNVILMY